MDRKRYGRRRSRDQWRELCRQWELSDLSQVEFCRRNGLVRSTFRLWLRRFSELESTGLPEADSTTPEATAEVGLPEFLPVKIAASNRRKETNSPTPSVDIVLKYGRIVRVHSGFDSELLKQIILTVEEIPC